MLASHHLFRGVCEYCGRSNSADVKNTLDVVSMICAKCSRCGNLVTLRRRKQVNKLVLPPDLHPNQR